MGGLAASIRSALEAVNAQTATIQGNVTHEAWIGRDGYDKPAFDAPVLRTALIQEGSRQVRLTTGDVITTKACLSFLSPIPPNGASGRREPVDPRDRFTLPSGLTGPIVEAPGAAIDPSTGRPFISVFWLK